MKETKLNRRDFLRASAMAAGAVALVACAPATTATTEPTAEDAGAAAAAEPTATEAPVVDPNAVTWWYAWGNLDPATEKISQTDEFKAMLNGNTFNYRGSISSEIILTAVAAGTPPDGGSNFDYPNLFSRGAAIPVNDYVAASTKIDKNDILDKLWESAFYGDKMIGVPGIEGYMWWGLNVNIHAAEEAGLDVSNLPLTWETVYDWHKALTKFDDAGNLKQFGLDPYDAMAGETDFPMQSFGGRNWWDEQNRVIDLNNDAMIEALDKTSEFIKLIGPDKFAGMRQTTGMGGWGASYNAGMQTMIMEGYWHPGETEIQQPDIAQYNRATWAPVPESRKGAKIMATGAHFVQIFKDAKHKDEIFKVGEFLITDTAQDIIFKEVGWIFGRKSYLAKIDPKAYPGLDFYIDAPADVTEWIIGRRCPIHWFIADQYTELREKVYRGEMTPTEAAAELQRRAEDEWDAQGLS